MTALVLAPSSLPSSVPPAPRRLNPDQEDVRKALVLLLPSLRAHAQRLCRSGPQAEDLVQETALRALRFAHTFTQGTHVRAWLHQILDSVFISRCRRGTRERRAHDVLGRDPCAWIQQDAAPEMQSLAPRLRAALEELPPTFRKVVELVDMGELSYRAAADELRVPVGTVMSRLYRGRRLLEARLTEPRAA